MVKQLYSDSVPMYNIKFYLLPLSVSRPPSFPPILTPFLPSLSPFSPPFPGAALYFENNTIILVPEDSDVEELCVTTSSILERSVHFNFFFQAGTASMQLMNTRYPGIFRAQNTNNQSLEYQISQATFMSYEAMELPQLSIVYPQFLGVSQL